MTPALWYMLVVGVIYASAIVAARRHKRSVHYWLVGIGIAMDVGLTLYIEFVRDAVAKTTGANGGFTGNRTLLFIHVSIACLLLAGYVVMLINGIRLAKNIRGRRNLPYPVRRARHRLFGYVAFSLYVGSFLTAPGGWIEKLLL